MAEGNIATTMESLVAGAKIEAETAADSGAHDPTELQNETEAEAAADSGTHGPTELQNETEAEAAADSGTHGPTELPKETEADAAADSGPHEPTELQKETEAGAAADSGPHEPTELQNAIIRQVEYYFGDYNLRRDFFLEEEISNNEGGWVPLSLLLTFRRLAALTTDAQVVVDAVLMSDEGLVEVSEDKQKLRRNPERPVPTLTYNARQELVSRSIYAGGFPLDEQPSDIIDFFGQFEKTLHISMRKYIDRQTREYKFRGSVFVAFAKKEQAAAFIAKDEVLYKGHNLIRKWQKEYLDERNEKTFRKKMNKKAAAEAAAMTKN